MRRASLVALTNQREAISLDRVPDETQTSKRDYLFKRPQFCMIAMQCFGNVANETYEDCIDAAIASAIDHCRTYRC